MGNLPALRVGFVGLGDMGGAIASRIIDAGYPTTLWARRDSTLAPFAGRPFHRAADLHDLGRQCDVVGVCVFSDADVRDVLLGERGVLSGLAHGGIVVIHSTISVDTCVELGHAGAIRGVAVLDAPVSGARAAAVAGQLAIMVGGERDALARIETLLRSYGRLVQWLGPLGSGQKMKVLNNVLAFANGTMALTAMRTGRALGLELEAVKSVLRAGSARSFSLDIMVEQLMESPDFARHAATMISKDTAIFEEIRKAAGLPRTLLVDAAEWRVNQGADYSTG